MKLWDITSPEHPLIHTFAKTHPLGVHHVAASRDGKIAASAGFGGEIVLWDLQELESIGSIAGTFWSKRYLARQIRLVRECYANSNLLLS